jgi:NarL family two-component system response regulator LiaR
MRSKADVLRIVIADDHQVVREGLRAFLGLFDDVRLVGEAADGAECVELVLRESPDVVLMDLVMPGMDGIEATHRLMQEGSSARVIALTSFAEDDKVIPALRAGACSYLLKDVSPDHLIQAIRAAHRGEARLHPDIIRILLEQVAWGQPDAPAPGEELTRRELEVVRLVAQGLNNREIARRLVISEKTVKTHVSNALGKLGLADRTQLAVHALQTGLAALPARGAPRR